MKQNTTKALFAIERRVLLFALVLILLAGVFFVLGSLTGKNQVGQATAEAGLIAWYPFEEGSGMTVLDGTDNGQDGILSTSSGTWVTGYSGQGLQISSYFVTVPDSDVFDNQQLSIEAYVKPSGYSAYGYGTIVKKDQQFILRFNPDKCLYAYLFGSSTQEFKSSICDLPLNSWHKVAFTYDGTTARFYQDDTLMDEQPASLVLRYTSTPLTIGGANIPGEYFQGVLDEIKIYDRAVSYGLLPTIESMSPADDYTSYRRNLNITCTASYPGSGPTSIELAFEGTTPNAVRTCTTNPCTATFDVPGVPNYLLSYADYSWQCIANSPTGSKESAVRTLHIDPYFTLPETYATPESVLVGTRSATVVWPLVKEGTVTYDPKNTATALFKVKLKSPISNPTPELYGVFYPNPGLATVIVEADDLEVTPGGINNQDVYLEWTADARVGWTELRIDTPPPYYSGQPSLFSNASVYRKYFNVTSSFPFRNSQVVLPVDIAYGNWKLYQGSSGSASNSNTQSNLISGAAVYDDLSHPVDKTQEYGLTINPSSEEASFTFDPEASSTYNFLLEGTITPGYSLDVQATQNANEGDQFSVIAYLKEDMVDGNYGTCTLAGLGTTKTMTFDQYVHFYSYSTDQLAAGTYTMTVTCTIPTGGTLSKGINATVQPLTQNPSYNLTVSADAGKTANQDVNIYATLKDAVTGSSVSTESCTLFLDEDQTTLDMPYATSSYKATVQFPSAGDKYFTVSCTEGSETISADSKVSILSSAASYLLSVNADQDKKVDESVGFRANLTNKLGAPVSNGQCTLTTDGQDHAMVYSTGLYRASHTFTTSGDKAYSVRCAVGADGVNTSSHVVVYAPSDQYGLTISADEDKRTGDAVTFRAQVKSLQTSQIYNGASCTLELPDTTKPMTYNAPYYTATSSFSTNGEKSYTVTCIAGDQTLELSDSIYIRSYFSGGSPLLLKGNDYIPPDDDEPVVTKKKATFTYDDNITKVVLEFNLEYGDTITLDLFKVGANPVTDPTGTPHSFYRLNASYPVNYAIISYRVPLSWITEQGIEKEDVQLKRYQERWISLPTYYEGDVGDYATYTSYSSDLGIFSIVAATGSTIEVTNEDVDDILQKRRDIDPTTPPEEESSSFSDFIDNIHVPSWIWYTLGGLLAAVVIVIFVLSVIKNLSNKEIDIDPDSLEQIRQYYLDCYNQGLSPEQIHDNLLSVGWDREVLDKIFNRGF